MTKNKKIVSILFTFLFAFVTLFTYAYAFFGSDNKVFADDVSPSFYGSDIYIPCTMARVNTGLDTTTASYSLSPSKFRFSLENVTDNNVVYRRLYVNTTYMHLANAQVGIYYIFNGQYFVDVDSLISSGTTQSCIMDMIYGSNTWYLYFLVYVSGNDFSFDISYVTISPVNDHSFFGYFNGHWIKYYDGAGNYIAIGIPAFYNDSDSGYWTSARLTERTYYLPEGSLSSDTYYQTGYSNGYNDGYTDGIDENQTTIYNNGYQTGYNNGYSSGQNDANTYTFANLIGAAFDVPIDAFKSAFNYNVLGINLKDFFFAILTFGIVIFIVRLITGKK